MTITLCAVIGGAETWSDIELYGNCKYKYALVMVSAWAQQNGLVFKGYHLKHNFGHGQNHLASLLLTLNLLAFLFHTVLHLVDKPYQQLILPKFLNLELLSQGGSITDY